MSFRIGLPLRCATSVADATNRFQSCRPNRARGVTAEDDDGFLVPATVVALVVASDFTKADGGGIVESFMGRCSSRLLLLVPFALSDIDVVVSLGPLDRRNTVVRKESTAERLDLSPDVAIEERGMECSLGACSSL